MTVNYSDVVVAHDRIRTFVHKTPVLTSRHIDQIFGAKIFFKCENFQLSGSFKARGAHNALYAMDKFNITKGVVTHSSGNHAAAVAVAAKRLNTNAYVVMPSSAPLPKKKAVRGYGALVTECEPTLKAREAAAAKIVEETGATFLHPYNDVHVIAGQGTAAKELIEKIKHLDVMICPVGGGGLLGGSAISTKHLLPKAKMLAAEPSGADDAKQSFEKGVRLHPVNPKTIADGLLTTIGERNFQIMQTHVDDVYTVTEEAIIEAMKLIWQYMKIIIEPSSAVPLAILLEHELESVRNKNIGIILSGGNVDIDKLPWYGL